MNAVVYFPYLTPPIKWLKLAALCWDQVYTLSTSAPQNVPENIAELDERLGGVLCPLDTARLGSLPAVKESFEQWLDTSEARASLGSLESHANVPRFEDLFEMSTLKWPGNSTIVGSLERRGLSRGSFSGERKTYVGPSPDLLPAPGENKLSYIKRLRTEGLIESDSYLLLPRNIALHYLSLCAAQAATEHGADLCAQTEMFAESAIISRKGMEAQITSNLVEAFIPEDLDTIPIQAINDIRLHLSSQRLRFASAIQSVIDEITKVSSPSEFQKIRIHIEDIALQRIEETKKTYSRARLSAVSQALGMSLVPAPLSSLSALSLLHIGIFAPAAIASALALGFGTFYAQVGKAMAEKKSSPWSYVIELQDRLS